MDLNVLLKLYLDVIYRQNTSVSSIAFDAAAAAKLLQSCPTLCDPIDGSLTGCCFCIDSIFLELFLH